ncbi:MAG: hypothetical protein ACRD11_16120 [Terriglobia bacterium]
MIELCIQAGHPAPEFLEAAGDVGVRFVPAGYVAPHKVALDLSERQRLILQALAGGESLSFGELRRRVAPGIADRTLRDDLLHLKRLMVIGSKGRGRGASWHLFRPGDQAKNKAE